MLFEQEVQSQLELLVTYRRTLVHYLRQQAILGAAYAPPGVTHGLFETREHIRRVKSTLRSWKIKVDDHPDDEDVVPPITPRIKLHLVIMFGFTALICAFLSLLQTPSNLVTVVGFGIMAVYSAIISTIPLPRSLLHTSQSDFIENLYGNPLLISFYIFCYYEFLSRLTGSLVGGIVGAALTLSGADNAIDTTLPIITTTFVGLSSIVTVIPISKYATHKIKRIPLVWVYSVLIFSAVFDNTIISLVYNTGISLIGVALQVVITNLMFLTSIIGYLWAKQTHIAYIMMKLFRNLSQSDRNALVDLIYGVTNTSID